MPSETLTAAGYCRVSTADQAEHGFSLGEQERLLREDAERRGETFLRAYVDAGLSGRSKEKRPELNRMLDAADQREFDVLIIPSLDRLARNARDAHAIFAHLEQAGVAIRSLRGDVDTASATGKLMTGLMASFAEFESNVIGERTRAGKRAAARKGRPNGGPRAFGFDRADGALVPRPAEIAVVRRIFEEYVAGTTQTQIAVGLNRDGFTTARGCRWNQSQVSQVIRDPLWVGVIRNKEGEFEGAHGEVIPRDLWEQAQAISRSSGRRGGGRPAKNFLLGNGLLHCGRCGSSMRVRREPKQHGWWEAYCCNGRESGQTECDQPAVQRKLVDESVLTFFNDVALDVDAMLAEFAADRDRRLADLRVRRDNARSVHMTAEQRLARLDQLLADGDLTPDEWRNTSEQHRRDLEAAKAALEGFDSEEQEIESEQDAADAEERTLEALGRVRQAVAGEITGAGEIEAAQCAIRRVFRCFVLHPGWTHDGYSLEPVPHEESIETRRFLHDADGEPVAYVKGLETYRRQTLRFPGEKTKASRP